ncbi:putative GTP cyclohydrolase I [Triangularia verruculosa]|uniref:GTP cyclohydrolase 1 n=1 Tax=Triangularia verruculosa TaxID=2587418 RepID=A0AAN7ASC9_9PEZI|nr:putative GTP cyclohydrolase I [Triangularia verruculosa]
MVQFASPSRSHSPSGASSDNEPRRTKKSKSKDGSNKKKRASADDQEGTATTANGTSSNRTNAERRSSMSKPARDFRDQPEPTPKKKKRKTSTASAAVPEPSTAPTPEDAGETSTRSPSPVIDFDGLSRPSLGTRERLDESPEQKELRMEKMKGAVRTLLECVGEDPDREGLLATPERYAKAMLFLTKGYQENVRDIVNGAIFQEGHNEMVIVKDIEVFSMCEHHLVPFTGKMHIGYIPSNAVIGISKLPRIAELFARRLQIQERLTKDVAHAIMEVLKPQGVAVVMESSHLCMVMRGVEKTTSSTITSCVLGCFESKEKTRNEFLSLIGVNRR